MKKFLVTKYQGMGSLVIAAPAIKRLRQVFPEAKIIFLGTNSTSLLAQKMTEFDDVLILNDESLIGSITSSIKIIFRLRKEKIDCSFDLEVYSHLAAIYSTLFNAKKRVGFIYRSSSSRQYVYTDLIYFNKDTYLGLAYWRLFASLASKAFENETFQDYKNWKLKPLRENISFPENYVVLNIHSSLLSLERRWPKKYFEEWTKHLLECDKNIFVILIGYGKEEIEEVNTFYSDPRVLKMAGLLNLDEVIHCLSKAKLVISNDSAPLHFAASMGSQVIGLFGPTKAINYFPFNQSHTKALQKETYCSPCVHHWDRPPCKGDNQCMKQLPWSELWKISSPILNINQVYELKSNQDLVDETYFAGRFYK